jgi:hypothetical protein
MRSKSAWPSTETRRLERASTRTVKGNPTKCAEKNAPARIEYPHPLSWWRVRPAHAFKDADVFIARHFLKQSAILGEPHWFLGAAGDPAIALGVAIRIRRQERSHLIPLDLAMTAVLCVALEGDAAAAIFLASTLKLHSSVDPACEGIHDTWLVKAAGRRCT